MEPIMYALLGAAAAVVGLVLWKMITGRSNNTTNNEAELATVRGKNNTTTATRGGVHVGSVGGDMNLQQNDGQ
jgi:hypothetical protein